MKFGQNFFKGGVYCLDFCNTYDHRNQPAQFDFFADRNSVVEWGKAKGTLPKKNNEEARNAFFPLEKLHSARELMFRIFNAFAYSKLPALSDLAALDDFLRETAAEFSIVRAGRGYRLACTAEDPVLRVHCEALRSAADLLVSGKLDRIRKCAGCGWLFYDRTRNGSRKWCTMKICGNRAKAHRHYQKTRMKRAPARH
ncbi:MAG: CGNR zinc finger domain-containing protein [Anaerolineales bacterium]|nr:CGNR zinc finger domain-containing protein [Anaerolineales bacterium]